MTATMDSMIDCAPRSSPVEPPHWFIQSAKQQCAALPLPVCIVVGRSSLTMAYANGLLVERHQCSTHEGASQSPYALTIPGSPPMEFDMPEECEELAQYLN